MILVTGAAGKTGRAVVGALASRSVHPRALIRLPEQAPILAACGARESMVGDLLDGTSLRRAMDGVQTVLHIPPNVSPHEFEMGRSVLEAALAAGVERLVYHSVLHPHVRGMPHHWEKARVEELLFASRLAFTILQPTAYMQNILASWETIVADGRYPIPYAPETALSLVDLLDVAEAAAVVLTESGYTAATLELVGTPPLSQQALAETLGARLGRQVRADPVPRPAWEHSARSSGLEDYQVAALSRMFAYYEAHGLSGNPLVLAGLLNREPTSFAEFVRRTIEERGK